jgi:hypothetical protein
MSGPDIFFSYARQDEARVAPVVAALRAHGWSVFWDRPPSHSLQIACNRRLSPTLQAG